MNKRILFNAFHMNCVVHQSPGLWVRPEDQMPRYTELETWVELARLLERGCFDALFLADVVGFYDVYRDSCDAALTQATQAPLNDPALLIPAMAYATKHLGFAFTSSIVQYHPYIFARLVSTLDHLTNGRIAWNIVTTYLESGARGLGLPGRRTKGFRSPLKVPSRRTLDKSPAKTRSYLRLKIAKSGWRFLTCWIRLRLQRWRVGAAR